MWLISQLTLAGRRVELLFKGYEPFMEPIHVTRDIQDRYYKSFALPIELHT